MIGALGAYRAWIFIQEDLAPEVETSLARTLNRPVELGAVEGFSLSSLRFGASAVPPTATDQDQLTLESIEVRFNLLEVLWQRRLGLNLTLIRPTIFLDQTKDGAWIQIPPRTEEGEGFIKTELDTIRVQNGTLVLVPYPRTGEAEAEPEAESEAEESITSIEEFGITAPLRRVRFEQINGTATLSNNNQYITFDATTRPASGGEVELGGEVRLDSRQVKLAVQGQDLLGADVLALIPLPLTVQAGRLGGNLEIALQGTELQAINGTGQFRDATATIRGIPNQFTNATGRLGFQGRQIELDNVRGVYGQIPARASGTIHLDNGYNLLAQARSINVINLLETFDLNSPVPVSGSLNADLTVTGALDQPRVNGTARNAAPIIVDRVNLETVRSQFNLTPEALTFDEIVAIPAAGGRVVGEGRVIFDTRRLAFNFEGRNLPGELLARPYRFRSANLQFGAIAAQAQVAGTFNNIQTTVQWQAPEATYAGRGEILITGNTIRFRDTVLRVAGGTVNAIADVVQGRWQATVDAAGVQLRQFSPDLRGLFSGNLRLAGTLDNLSPSGVRAAGQVRFSEGIAIIDRPTTATVRWTGERLEVQQATAPGFSARGYILAQLQGQGAPAITGLNLDVQLQDYSVAALPIPTPEQIQLAGQADFVGRVTGTPAAPNVVGRLGLNNAAVNELQFEPVLTGTFQYGGGQGLALNVAGEQDRIEVRLNANNRPTYFLIQQDDAIAQGRGDGNRLMATLENFPLQVLNLRPAAEQGLGEIAGRLNGNFDINIANLANPSVIGEVAIAAPAIGYIDADSFIGRIRYANGIASLTGGELRLAQSRYLISGSFTQGPTPQFAGQIIADQGRVEDILTALQFFEIEDIQRGIAPPTYAGAEAVETFPIDVTGAALLTQLRRYSEIVTLVNQQRLEREQSEILPALAGLQGAFSGSIEVASAPATGVEVGFNLQGQDWRWGDDYTVDQVVANGNFGEGVLTVQEFRLQSQDRFLTFAGQVGGEQQSGLLQAQNIPVDALQDLVSLPVDVDGNLNATATLAGSLQNPQVIGEIQLANATLNNTLVQEARSAFGYNNARLNFAGRVIVAEPEPLQITGSIPYAFQFMDTAPTEPGINLLPEIQQTDDITLDVNVENEGLALLNLLTRGQLAFQGGAGEVNLQVRGTLRRPQATGIAEFRDATLTAQALPEPVTDVTGTILFNSDRIQVQDLQGQFSEGQVSVIGTLPIFNATTGGQDRSEQNVPLTLNLSNIALEYAGANGQELYNGGVEGQIIITGTAFSPLIGGKVVLSEGQVFVATGPQPAVTPGADGIDPTAPDFFTPQLNNLKVILGDRLQIIYEPILQFVATGDLTISGAFNDLRPRGTVNLRSGQVNIFTTQFSLARGYDSRAVFTPSGGLNPYIDIRLVTNVLEVTRTPIQSATPFAVSEVADRPAIDYGALQTVRIQADIQAPADEILSNLELSSSPQRTQNEIVALLGGGFVDTLGRGEEVLAIANLAGSALLSRLQNFITNTLGVGEFRLFPTTIASDEDRTSSLGLAAELGVDITQDFSVSALQILTDENVPTQFNLRYRLSDEFLLRGSTNLSGDSRLLLEFQTRF
jgi:translocation and assembly module TamB